MKEEVGCQEDKVPGWSTGEMEYWVGATLIVLRENQNAGKNKTGPARMVVFPSLLYGTPHSPVVINRGLVGAVTKIL